MKNFKILLASFTMALLAASPAHAQLDKFMKGAADLLPQHAPVTPAPNVPTAPSVPQRQAPTSQSTGAQQAAPATVNNAVLVRTNTEIDIRGLKIDMSFADAVNLIKSIATDASACAHLQFSPEQDGYAYGDELINCKGTVQYFGKETDIFNVFFADGKIAYIVCGYFTSETKKEELPDVFVALAEKYNVQPKINKRAVVGGEFDFTSQFLDPKDNVLSTSGHLEQEIDTSDNSDINEQSKVTISLTLPNFDAYQQGRLKKAKDIQEQERQQELNRGKSQL